MSRKPIATKRLTPPDGGVKHSRFLRKPFQIIRANFRANLIINAIVYGSFIAGLVATMVFPNLGATQVAIQKDNGTAELARSLELR